MMANVPPQRFNYQQRVGRAGRMGQAFSYALTMARDRSHDDYYFRQTGRITGDVPPQPFLDTRRERILKRVASAELLRRAFRSLSSPPGRTPNSIHGMFGQTADWHSEHRTDIQKFLGTTPDPEEVVNRFGALTGLHSDDLADLARWARHDLVPAIDKAVDSPFYLQAELSELLANAGILPMFGFPTRVRDLYGKWINSRDDLDTQTVSNRSLDQAVGNFSPGAEVVREGRIHTSVGFAAYDIRGGSAYPVDPLGPALNVQRCVACGGTDLADGEGTESCGACGSAVEQFPLFQPLGFRTRYSPRDYDDMAEGMGNVGFPQLTSTEEPGTTDRVAAMTVERWRDPVRVVRINDNNGSLFPLLQLKDRSVVCDDEALYDGGPNFKTEGSTRLDPAAIGEVRPTDVVTLTLDGLALQHGVVPTWSRMTPAGLPAMWSFAEVFRRGCQVALDLQPDELEVGLQPARINDIETRRVFLADRLENGAGYAPEIGRPSNLKEVLHGILTVLVEEYESETHGDCTDACPNCLRSWDNRILHGALDWRLALDVATLANGELLPTERWFSRADQLTAAFVRAYGPAIPCRVERPGGLHAIVRDDNKVGVILGHPLWMHDEAHLNETQAESYEILRSELGVESVCMSDLWVLHRQQPAVFGLLSAEA